MLTSGEGLDQSGRWRLGQFLFLEEAPVQKTRTKRKALTNPSVSLCFRGEA